MGQTLNPKLPETDIGGLKLSVKGGDERTRLSLIHYLKMKLQEDFPELQFESPHLDQANRTMSGVWDVQSAVASASSILALESSDDY